MKTYPWDPPGLAPRTPDERCARHKYCAYRDDDPNRCPVCHSTIKRCAGKHGSPAYNQGWWGGVAGASHGSLRAGQHNDPTEESKCRYQVPQDAEHVSEAA
jgi:hypothetical protein